MDRYVEERLDMLATDPNCPVDCTDIVLICSQEEDNDAVMKVELWLSEKGHGDLALLSQVTHLHSKIWGGRYAFKNPDLSTYHEFDEFLEVVSNAGWIYPADVQLLAKNDDLTRFQQWGVRTTHKMTPCVTITPEIS